MMLHALIFCINNNNFYRGFGAHKIASWLRHHGWNIEVIDFTSHFTIDELKELLKSRINNNTKFIAFSDVWGSNYYGSNNELYKKYMHFQGFIKYEYPSIKLIVGSQEIANSLLRADYYIQGFGEHAILEVVKNIIGTNTNKLKYTLYRSGKLVKASDYPAIHATDPMTRYEPRDFISPIEQLGIEMSRGCKFECDFCTYMPLGVREDNFRQVDNYVENLKYMNQELGITSFFLSDSTANVSNEKLELFGDATNRLNFRPWICGFIRADLLIAHSKSWDSLIAMGVFGHSYGIETFNHASAKSIGKGMHPDKIKKGLLDIRQYFNKHGIYRNTISLIPGLPYESWNEHLQGINWIYDNLPESNVGLNALEIPKKQDNEPTRPSLFTQSYEKFGYVDTNPGDNQNKLSWYNTNTKESLSELREKIRDSNYARETYYSPWVVGIVRQMKNCSLEQALQEKYTSYNDGIDNTGFPFYSDESNRHSFIDQYIYKKLSL